MWNATHSVPPLSPQLPMESFLTNSNTDSAELPPWLVAYIQWHQQQRSQFNETNELRFLILTCHRDSICGGISDRLKSIPLLLQFAALHERIFLIHHGDVPLEYFLLPAQLDWRLPVDMFDYTASGPYYRRVADLMTGLSTTNATVVQVALQDQHGGSQWYNAIEEYRRILPQHEILSQLSSNANISMSDDTPHRHFRHAFRSIWSALFVPSPFLATAIQQRQLELGLTGTPYVAAHVRALYRPMPVHRQTAFAMHALQCASALRQDATEPIVLLSDSIHVLEAALDYGRNNQDSSIRVTVHGNVHLDQAHYYFIQEYMNSFVDLYIMANAHCISHGRGGFGRLGVLLSRNASCFFPYYRAGKTVSCDM